jgi:hypothetical protein
MFEQTFEFAAPASISTAKRRMMVVEEDGEFGGE